MKRKKRELKNQIDYEENKIAKKDEKIIYITKHNNKLLVPCIFIAHKIHVIVINKNIV